MIVTKKHCHVEHSSKVWASAVALPLLDAMTPALARPAEKTESAAALAFRLCAERHRDEVRGRPKAWARTSSLRAS